MGNIKVGYIPVGQAITIESKTLKIKQFFKNNKIGVIIGSASILLLSVYTVLIINFIDLIKIIY